MIKTQNRQYSRSSKAAPNKRMPDFKGIASAYNVRCGDGVIISHGAFDHQIGARVPLMNNHQHGDMTNVLGHVILTEHPKGIGFEAYTNSTPKGAHAKTLVHSGDIQYVSIWANQLEREGNLVTKGSIREVSLVISGQNPGAYIEEVVTHSADGIFETQEDQFIIHTGIPVDYLFHAADEEDEEVEDDNSDDEKTVGEILESMTPVQQQAVAYLIHAAAGNISDEDDEDDDDSEDDSEKLSEVFDTLTDAQKTVVFYYVGQVLEARAAAESADAENEEDSEDDIKQSYFYGDEDYMTSNVFNTFGSASNPTFESDRKLIVNEIFQSAVGEKPGSFRQSFIKHAATFGFEDVGILFPEAKAASGEPFLLRHPDEWVSEVLPKTQKLPFNRIRSRFADITAEEARARGYIKADEKFESVYALFGRVTYPQTIFTKQKMDRDDVNDITDFNVVLFMQKSMRIKWEEEVSRAILIGDGRTLGDPLKISPQNVRPIYSDDEVYAKRVEIPQTADILDVIDSFVSNMVLYKGSGTPTLFTSVETYSEMMVVRDSTGRRIHDNTANLNAALGVNNIVKVPFLTNLTREVTVGGVTKTLKTVGILVNMADYAVGFTPGGNAQMLESFDIDFNQHIYLYEGRLAGALVTPSAAVIYEQVVPTP